MIHLLAAAVLGTVATTYVLAESIPASTAASKPDPTAILAPDITTPPRWDHLARRSGGNDSAQETIWFQPDNICGYISADDEWPYSCLNDLLTCAFIQKPNTANVACCDSDRKCDVWTTCYDYAQYYYSSACDSACLANGHNVVCTDSDYPYCQTASFFSGILDHWCGTFSDSTLIPADTTYDGQINVTPLSELVVSTTGISTIGGTVSIDEGRSSSSSSKTSATATSATASRTSSSTTSSGGGRSGKKSSHTGAIVGGTVGGIAGLVLIGGLLAWVLIKQRRKRSGTTPQTQYAPVPPQGPNDGKNPVSTVTQQQYYNPDYPQQQPYPTSPLQQQQPYYVDPSQQQQQQQPAELAQPYYSNAQVQQSAAYYDASQPQTQHLQPGMGYPPQTAMMDPRQGANAPSPVSNASHPSSPQPGYAHPISPEVYEADGNQIGQSGQPGVQFHELSGSSPGAR